MKTLKRALCLLLVFSTMCSLFVGSVSAASTTPYDALSSSCYAKVFTLATSGRQTVYTKSDLKTPGNNTGACNAWIDCAADELWLMDVGVTNGQYWAHVSYPVSSGRRTGFIPLSALTSNSHAVKSTSSGKFYCSPRLGKAVSSSYYVAASDVIWLVAVNGSQVQLLYPTSSGYRLAWAAKSDYVKYCGTLSNDPVDVTAQFAGKTITLQSVENGNYLCAEGNDTNVPLCANRNSASTWETFTVSKMTSDGWVGIQAYNGKYLSAMANATDTPIRAAASNLLSWECFRIYQKGNDYYLKAQVNGKWLCVRVDQSNAPVQAYAGAASTWERLTIRIVQSKEEQAVQERLNSIANGTLTINSSTVMKVGSTFTGYRASEECKGYAKNVFYLCFGIHPGSTQPRSNGVNYLLYETAGMTRLGSVTTKSESDVANLFVKARPGDFVQIRRSGGSSHSAIVYSVTSTGVTFLEANLDWNNTVSMKPYTWADLNKNAAMSVYTASDYQLT